jgi:hypothetical protein
MRTIQSYFNKSTAILCVAVALLVASCSKQLNILPESYPSPQTVYKDISGARAGLTGVYQQLQNLKKSEDYLVGVLGTDEARGSSFLAGWGGYWQHVYALSSYNNLYSPQNQVLQDTWRVLYNGVNNSNTAIASIAGIAGSADIKNEMIGEAKFMRSIFYFYLVQFYGAVPMPTEVQNPEAISKGGYPKSDSATVYRLIISDLQFAINNLQPKSANNVGMANQEAAETLLGKVYLTRHQYDSAKLVLAPLMTSTTVGLLSNYPDLFKESNENNKESLFEIQYSNDNGNTNGLANMFGGWYISNTKPGGGGEEAIPTDYYDNCFESLGDARRTASIHYQLIGSDGKDYAIIWAGWITASSPHFAKYDINAGDGAVNGGLSPHNVYYLRYADAVLMYAEATNELNNTSEALTYLNKIRNRATLPGYEVKLGHTPSQQEMRTELLAERMRELGMEGWRWCDLKRTGNLISYVTARNPIAGQYITTKHLLMPISSIEFESNGSLKPADQNPGY